MKLNIKVVLRCKNVTRSNFPCSASFSQELNALQRRSRTALINSLVFVWQKQFASALRRAQ